MNLIQSQGARLVLGISKGGDIIVISARGHAKDRGKQVSQQRRDRWHAGADDSAIAFDNTPIYRGSVVIWIEFALDMALSRIGVDSHVGFGDFANWTRDCNRRQLITVILQPVSSMIRDLSQESSQESSAEHQNDLELFLVVKGQAKQRSDWQTHDSQVHCDLHRGFVPRVCVDIDAGSSVLACPAKPEELHRCALEDHDEDVGNTEAG